MFRAFSLLDNQKIGKIEFLAMSFCVQLLDISCHDIIFDIEETLYNAFLLLKMGGTRVSKFLRQ